MRIEKNWLMGVVSKAAAIGAVTVLLTACGGGGDEGSTGGSLNSQPSSTNTATNNAPTISGTPPTTGQVGQSYSFQPSASDQDGDAIAFEIANKPAWATFSSVTGQLSGTPTAQGAFANITISAKDSKTSSSLPAFTITVGAATGSAANNAPTISGTPLASVAVGTNYAFQPAASDADGDTLTFSVQGAPAWLSFNSATGKLSGAVTASNVGTYSGITISVSDGKTTSSLGAFTLTVLQIGNGKATLSWTAPTQYADGTALTDLSGYRVYYGTTAASLDNSLDVTNPSITTFDVTNLTAGTYYFAVKAITSANMESDMSNVASKVIL